MPRAYVKCRSERRDRKITQPQFGEPAFFPQPEQCPIECLPQQIIAASDRDTDAFAKKATLQIGTPAEHAAICGICAIEPKSERDAVAEQQVDFTAFQRKTCGIGVRKGARLSFGEKRLEVSLMRSACDNCDLFSFKKFRTDALNRTVAPDDKSRGRSVIRIAEINPRPHVG